MDGYYGEDVNERFGLAGVFYVVGGLRRDVCDLSLAYLEWFFVGAYNGEALTLEEDEDLFFFFCGVEAASFARI